MVDRIDAVLVDFVRRHTLFNPYQRSEHPTRLLLAAQHRIVIDSVRRTRYFPVRIVQIDQKISSLRRALLLTHPIQPVKRQILRFPQRIVHRSRVKRGIRRGRRHDRAVLRDGAVHVVLIEDVEEARAQTTS